MTNMPAAEVVISMRDGSGSVGRVVLSVPDATSVAAARGAIQALLGPLAALSGCVVVGYSITYSTHLTSANGDPGQLAGYRGLFVFATALEDQYLVVSVPAIDNDLVDDAGDIDPAQPAIAQFVSAIVDGIWCNPFEADATTLINSYLQVDP